MNRLLQNTGTDSYVSRYTYGQAVQQGQKILVRDEDATALLAATTKNDAGTAIPVFTLLASGTADLDVTKQYRVGDPLTVGDADTASQITPRQLAGTKALASVGDIRRRFLDSFANGAAYRSRRCLMPIPAWTTGMLLTGGAVVKNAGNVYYLLSTYGANLQNQVGIVTVDAPIGTGPGPITGATDLLRWLYMGAYDPTMDASSVDTPVSCAFTADISGNTLTVSAVLSGALRIGSLLLGAGVLPNTVITALGTGTGGSGTYTVNTAQTVASTSMTASGVYVATVPAANTRRYNTQVAADRAAMWITGGNFINQAGSGGGTNGISIGTQNFNSFAVSFVTNAPVIALNKVQHGGGGAMELRIFIDGIPLYAGQASPNGNNYVAASNNSNYALILDFSSKPIKNRTITIFLGNNIFTGVWIDPKYQIWAPSNPNRYRLWLEGDSITQGANPANGTLRSGPRLAMTLGCDDVWDTAVGGTGVMNKGSKDNLLSRLPVIIAGAPDIYYQRPIHNDAGWLTDANGITYNTTTRKAAYTKVFDTLLAALPNLIIICGGGSHDGTAANLTTDNTSQYQVELDMQAAIAEYNHPHVKFLPQILDPSGSRWIDGNGHVGTTINTTHGTSDLMVGDGNDQLHPNIRYYEYMEHRESRAILKIINELA